LKNAELPELVAPPPSISRMKWLTKRSALSVATGHHPLTATSWPAETDGIVRRLAWDRAPKRAASPQVRQLCKQPTLSKEVGLDADAPAALRSSIGNRYVLARNSDQSNFRAVFTVRMLTMPLRLTASIERFYPEVWLTSAPRPVWPRRADRRATACLLSVTAGLLKTSLMRLARSLAETGYRD